MRKILVLNYVSLDGFIAGTNGETDWFVWDEEVEKYYKEAQNSIDTIFFGRATYETMANSWSSACAGTNVLDVITESFPVLNRYSVQTSDICSNAKISGFGSIFHQP
jgi:dihydrofolate reductase